MGARSSGWRLAREFLPGLVALAALVTASGFGYVVRQRSDQAAVLAERTLLVREAAERLLGAVRDAETGQRGFVITGDRTFLEPFEAAGPLAAAETSRLRRLVRSQAQRDRLERMERLVAAKFAELDRTVALVKARRGADAVATVRSREGQRLMRRLRVEAEQFKAAESLELDLRQGESQRDAQRALAAARAAMLAMFAAVGVQLWQLRARRREMLSRAAELEEEVAARTEALNREKLRVEALLADVNHRVGNDLAAVGVLLAMQARRSGQAEVKTALEEAQARVRMIAEAQRRLRLDVGTDTVRAGHVLSPALDMLAERLAGAGIVVEADIADVAMPGRDALSLVIIVNELVTNAAKHAFPEGFADAKRVQVSLREVADRLELAVADGGVGINDAAGKGMGTQVVGSLAKGMGATVRRESGGGGARVVLDLKAA